MAYTGGVEALANDDALTPSSARHRRDGAEAITRKNLINTVYYFFWPSKTAEKSSSPWSARCEMNDAFAAAASGNGVLT